MGSKLWLLSAILCGVGLIAGGCGKKTADSAAAAGVPPGGETVIRQTPKDEPTWITDTPVGKGEILRFVGIGLPSEYEQKADESAAEQAGVEAARYMCNMVDLTTVISDKARNAHGSTPIDAIARDIIGKNVAAAVVRNNYGVSRFMQYCHKKDLGADVYYWKVYRLYELPRKAAADALHESRDKVQEEVNRQFQNEREDIKKELLKGSDDLLKAMEKQVLAQK